MRLEFSVESDDEGDQNGYSGIPFRTMKFEKCSTPIEKQSVQESIERIEKPIDKVTIERLDMVLRMCNIQLHHTLIDKIIDSVELIEEKGESVTLMDVCKMRSQWK